MAATQRAANASSLASEQHASAAALGSVEPAGELGGCVDGEDTFDRGGQEEGTDAIGMTGEVELPQVTLKFSTAQVASARRDASWHAKVSSGQLLFYNDIDELGKNRCKAYLRAMGTTVTRALEGNVVAMRLALREALTARNVGPGQAWSAARDTGGEEPPRTEGVAETGEAGDKAAEDISRSG